VGRRRHPTPTTSSSPEGSTGGRPRPPHVTLRPAVGVVAATDPALLSVVKRSGGSSGGRHVLRGRGGRVPPPLRVLDLGAVRLHRHGRRALPEPSQGDLADPRPGAAR